MNETIKILRNRSSVRIFKDKPIDQEIIDSILEAGLCSASAGNLQPVSIVQIQKKENKLWFTKNRQQKFIGNAPLNLLFCLDFYRLKKWSNHHKAPFVMDKSFRHFWVSFQDVIIMAQSIETAANSYGIGSTYIGTTFEVMPEIQEKFNLPKGVIPVVLLSMGYPKNERKISKKLSKDILVHKEGYIDHSIEVLESEFTKKYGSAHTELTDERKSNILNVFKDVYGDEKVKEMSSFLDETGKISTPMRYFGLHYIANYMACDNRQKLEFLYSNGFVWANKENVPEYEE